MKGSDSTGAEARS